MPVEEFSREELEAILGPCEFSEIDKSGFLQEIEASRGLREIMQRVDKVRKQRIEKSECYEKHEEEKYGGRQSIKDADMETSKTFAPKASTHSNQRPHTKIVSFSQVSNPGVHYSDPYNERLSQFFNQENMGKMMNQSQQKSGPSLNSVVNIEVKNKVLEGENTVERLLRHCPQGQQDKDGVRESLHCPSIRHIFSSLQNAIENGRGHILLSQMGIDLKNPGEYQQIVDLFNNIANG